MTSEQYMQQLEGMQELPNFRQNIADMYQQPVLEPITDERTRFSGRVLPALFEVFNTTGTSAADMSPQAKLALTQSNVNRINKNIGSIDNVLGYFDDEISRLTNLERDKFNNRRSTLSNLYNMAFGRERAQAEDDFRNRQLANQRAAMAQQSSGMQRIMDLINQFRNNSQSTNVPTDTSNPESNNTNVSTSGRRFIDTLNEIPNANRLVGGRAIDMSGLAPSFNFFNR